MLKVYEIKKVNNTRDYRESVQSWKKIVWTTAKNGVVTDTTSN